MKKSYLLMLMLLMALQVAAFNDEDYKEYAKQVKQQVWGMNLPQFNNRKVPEKYKKESAVYLAYYEDVSVDQKRKFTLMKSNSYTVNEIQSSHLRRFLVSINDQAALKEFSEFDYVTYDKQLNWGVGTDSRRNVVGVKVIKPDGTVREVSGDDYVNTNDKQTKEKRSKLAVPDLKVGDLVDIMIYSEAKIKEENVDPMKFTFVFDYPVLNYQIHGSFDRKFNVRYRTLNGAPLFKESTDGDNNIVLTLEQKNLDRVAPKYCYNPVMQSPMTILYVTGKVDFGYVPKSTKQKGLFANPSADIVQEDAWNLWQVNDWRSSNPKAIKEGIKKLNTDEEKADYIYNYFLMQALAKRYIEFRPWEFPSIFASVLKKYKIPFERVLTTDRLTEPLDLLINYGSTDWVIRLKNGKKLYYPIYTTTSSPSIIVALNQGRLSKITSSDKKYANGPFEPFTTPMSTYKDNTIESTLKVDLKNNLVDIDRTTALTGCYKNGLIPIFADGEQITKHWGTDYGITDMRDFYYLKSDKNSVAERLEEQRKKIEENFKEDVKDFHDDKEPVAVKKWEVTEFADHEKPLVYNVSYQEDGWIKKAGNNLVVSIGQMVGGQRHIEGRERKRDCDVILDYPETQRVTILLNIPAGYKVAPESLKKLNITKDNETGSFSSKAEVRGNQLVVTTEKIYKQLQVPVKKWPIFLEMLDAAYNFSTLQVVLKK